MKIIYTTDFEKEIWSLLGLFESIKYVMEIITVRFPSMDESEIKSRATHIGYCVRQAREYFSSAKTVSLLTSPLLLSYGMLNLAKSLVIMRLPEEVDFKRLFAKHGVSVDFSVLDDSVLNTKIDFQNYGVYPSLAKVLNEPSYSGNSVLLDQLLSQIPDLRDIYSLVYKKSPNVLPVKAIDYGYCPEEYEVLEEIFTDEFVEKLSTSLEILGDKGHCIDSFGRGFSIRKTLAAQKTLQELGLLIKAISGKEYLRVIPVLDETPLFLGDITLNYLVVFCYGMLARYQAINWGQYTDPNVSLEAEVIGRSLQICRHRFLHAIINALFDREFEFRYFLPQEKNKEELIDFIYDDLVRRLKEDAVRERSRCGLI